MPVGGSRPRADTESIADRLRDTIPTRLLALVVVGTLLVGGAAVVGANPSPTAAPGAYAVSVTDGAGTVNATWRLAPKNTTHHWVNVSWAGARPDANYTVPTNETVTAIRWAIQNTSARNDTVLVGDGVYNGSLDIEVAAITVRGVDTPVIDGSTTGGVYAGVQLSASNVTLEGLVVRDFDGIGIDDARGNNRLLEVHAINNTAEGIALESGSVLVDALARQNGGAGVQIARSRGAVIRSTRVLNNSVGIVIVDATASNRVVNVTVRGNGRVGIDVQSGVGTVITNSTITENGKHGIALSNTDDAVITNTTLSGNARHGIRVDPQSGTVTIRDTTITHSGAMGILIEGPNASVVETTLRATTGTPIVVKGSNATITGTRVANVSGTAIRVASGTGTSVLDTRIRNASERGIVVDSADETLLKDTVITGISTEPRGAFEPRDAGIVLTHGANHTRIINNTVTDTPLGVYIGNFAGVGVPPSGPVTIKYNTFRNGGTGLRVRDAVNVSVTDNRFQTNGIQIVDTGDSLSIPRVRAANTFDRAVLVESAGGTYRDRIWSLIDDAENRSMAGAVVHVYTGQYPVGLNVTTANVSIVGHGPDRPVIEGSEASTESAPPGIAVRSDNVTIRGLTIRGTWRAGVVVTGADTVLVDLTITNTGRIIDAGKEREAAGIRLERATGTVIKAVRITASYQGVFVYGSSDVLVTESSLENQHFGVHTYRASNVVLRDLSISGTTTGVTLQASSGVSVTNTRFTDNRGGIKLVGGDDIRIHANEFQNSDRYAITLGANSQTVTVTDNEIADTGEILRRKVTYRHAGIIVRSAGNVTIEGNHIILNRAPGIYVAPTTPPALERLVITGNVLRRNGDGIVIADPLEGQIKIVDNLIAGNRVNGIQLTDDASAAAVAIHYNTITANGRYGVLNANTSAVVNATYNDWGDPDGPNTSAEVTDAFDDPVTGFEADGEGDQVSGNTTTGVATVRFDPWLGQGTPSLAVGNLSAPNRVDPNTTITVTATITNVGDGPGTLTVPVTVDGTRVTVRTVALDENASTTVSFTTTLSTPGTKTIAVGSASTTVTVGDPAALTVESVTIQDTSVTVGETVLVTATIQNTGDLAGSTTITLRDDGTVIGERNISVSGGETVTVRFTPSFATAGGHRLVVEDTTAGTVTVRTAAQTTTTTTTTTTRTTTATTTSTSTRTTTTRSTTTRESTTSTTATSPTETTTRSTTTTTGDGGPGLTVLGTVVAVVVAALLAARRMD